MKAFSTALCYNEREWTNRDQFMTLGPSGLNYYYNVLCPLADKAFQFAFLCTLDRHLAEDKVVDTYRQFSQSLPAQGDSDTDLVIVIRSLWAEMDLLAISNDSDSLGSIRLTEQHPTEVSAEKRENEPLISSVSIFSCLPLIGRAVLGGIDVLGFDEEQMSFVLKLPVEEVCRFLAAARKAMLSVG